MSEGARDEPDQAESGAGGGQSEQEVGNEVVAIGGDPALDYDDVPEELANQLMITGVNEATADDMNSGKGKGGAGEE